jgi:hypothetical protein
MLIGQNDFVPSTPVGLTSMRRRRTSVIVAAIAFGFATFLLTVTWSRSPNFHGRSLLKVQIRESHLFPITYRDESAVLSNFLSGAEEGTLLTSGPRTKKLSFSLERVAPVRNTSLFAIDYRGPDSNAVQVVASNAANLAISFYSTNQPSWEASLIASGAFTPLSVWGQLEDFMASLWRRFKASAGW